MNRLYSWTTSLVRSFPSDVGESGGESFPLILSVSELVQMGICHLSPNSSWFTYWLNMVGLGSSPLGLMLPLGEVKAMGQALAWFKKQPSVCIFPDVEWICEYGKHIPTGEMWLSPNGYSQNFPENQQLSKKQMLTWQLSCIYWVKHKLNWYYRFLIRFALKSRHLLSLVRGPNHELFRCMFVWFPAMQQDSLEYEYVILLPMVSSGRNLYLKIPYVTWDKIL